MKKIILLIFIFHSLYLFSQNKNIPVFVDSNGIMRWTKDNSEASFFGVNYTVPFAYGYRSHLALGADLEKAIDADVYHMSRLGLDAFRVHLWDVEITDSLGNLLENEHLRLFDYLVMRLKERNIKIMLTPIAFWGNGYPERDEKTNGFSSVYGKGPSVVLEKAIVAQENYMKQFFTHVNPYTKMAYKDDPDIIATEINNEPHHSGPKERTTEYVNRLVEAIKSTGWAKPVFYNISESPRYADAIVRSNVVGHSFQWYPTGLVAGRELKGNHLPHVDVYSIPFDDTIPAFGARAKMVYEFDAGDVMQPIMYPAMVRSYRTAGFQWATQFAYDPMATAYGNTEYQTHYLNLAYTPEKAISLLIASKAFHQLPIGKSYGAYPADTVFGAFRVSYHRQLSEMNSAEEFYYTSSTKTNPVNIAGLQHIAGTGSSPVVEYEGTGAYFLDKVNENSWRLEVMPDAIAIRDPFEKASPKKTVTRIEWHTRKMKVRLPGLGNDFIVTPINVNNDYSTSAKGQQFSIRPGAYILSKGSVEVHNLKKEKASIDFTAPRSYEPEVMVMHEPFAEISTHLPFVINAKIAGVDSSDNMTVELRHSSNMWKSVPLQSSSAFAYHALVPQDMIQPGVISYRVIIRKSNGDVYAFPGGHMGEPFAWDYYQDQRWETFVVPEKTPLQIFNAASSRNELMIYSNDWRNNRIEYITSATTGNLVLKTALNTPDVSQLMGWQYYFRDQIKGRVHDLSGFNKLLFRVRSETRTPFRITLVTSSAEAFSAIVYPVEEFRDFEVQLNDLQPDSLLLLPRPYPRFHPLYFKSASYGPLDVNRIEKIGIIFGFDRKEGEAAVVEVESVYLK